MVKWEILIATLCFRAPGLGRLFDALLPQVDAVEGAVRVTALRNLGERPLAEIRQALLDQADAEYVCFIDDDDMVPDDYVATVLPLLDGVDFIGWRMQVYFDGTPQKPTFHSLQHERWESGNAWYGNVSHLNPVRLELARQASYLTGYPEDIRWSDKIAKLAKTEHYVGDDKIMYHYYTIEPGNWSPTASMWVEGSAARVSAASSCVPRPVTSSPYLAYHPDSTC